MKSLSKFVKDYWFSFPSSMFLTSLRFSFSGLSDQLKSESSPSSAFASTLEFLKN
jgi:hypothetical protein